MLACVLSSFWFQLALYDAGSVGLAAMAIPVGSLQVMLTTVLMVMPAYAAGHLDVLEDFMEPVSSQWMVMLF